MRICLCVGLVGLLGLVWAARTHADDEEKTRAVIDKAIKAAGGEEKLAKFKAHTWKEKGTYYGMGDGLPYTANYAVQFPDQFRMEIEGFFTMVVDGDKGWVKMADNTNEMTKEQLEEHKQNRYAGWVSHLAPLKDKEFTLAPLGEEKVADRSAVGVKVSRKGHIDVNLFFDKENGLLVKSAHRSKSAELGKEVEYEHIFSDHKEVDGLKIPMKLTIKRDGKQFIEAEQSDFKIEGKLDKSVFAKP